MTNSIIFDPLLAWSSILICAGIAAIFVGFGAWRRLRGWPLRALAVVLVLVALMNPSLQQEDRKAEPDIVIVVVDESSSQTLAPRRDQTARTLAAIQTLLVDRGNTDIHITRVTDTDDDGGTLLMTALAQSLGEVPRGRVAGVIVISDGQIHDAQLAPDLEVPLHLMQTGLSGDWDRRLVVKNAPGFAIVGDPTTLTVELQDQGAAPGDTSGILELAIDGQPPERFNLPLNQEVEVELHLPHGGLNVVQLSTPKIEGELTDRNNSAVLQINAVRDRLRVLLVSGVPHPGERTWRNLLKSDGSVDLVHFTILRPPEKQDGVPVTELSLIAFPTRELFLDKVHDFDLIIFDRYKRRGILPAAYFESIANYVRQGGAILVAAGPDYASVDSLFRSPLGAILPGEPTSIVLDEPILPVVSELGAKHPITQGLTDQTGDGDWGRWLRQIVVRPRAGHVLMTGKDDLPLLMVDRVDEGRVALIASDHAWLWDRGFEGGGPQAELLRRLSHWAMKEPELEEETIRGEINAGSLRIQRRSLEPMPDPTVEVVKPDGTVVTLPMVEVTPGTFEAMLVTPEVGLYQFMSAGLTGVMAVGNTAPREFTQTIASGDVMASVISARLGGIHQIENGIPKLRNVRAGRPASGRGWIGLQSRGGYAVQGISITPMLPVWLYLLIAAALVIGAWLWEGRRS